MLKLTKPPKLNKGDKVATISPSWGGAGEKETMNKYYEGKQRLEKLFDLEVVEMPHTLKNADYVYNHPKERADDLMQAFSDKSIKAIISCIGGTDSVRMLPYIDFDVIKNNSKIFMGYSDSTITHFMCLKSGLSSFYGPDIITDFGEINSMSDYTINSISKSLFDNSAIGNIFTNEIFTAQKHNTSVENKNADYELLQGKGIARGPLIGGCLEVLEYIKGTSLFPTIDSFDNSILFLETCDVFPPTWLIEDELRCYGIMGILERVSGILWGKPCNNMLYEDYKPVIKKVLAEFGRSDMPVLYNGSFGHNQCKTIIPYGAMAEINCDKLTFSIVENAVK